MSENILEIWTDGACSGNPGPGGWGAVLCWRGHEKEISGGAVDTTNNRMELKAVIAGLEEIKRAIPVRIYTDSKYVQNGMTKWVKGWMRNGWRTKAGDPVKNVDLWKRLHELCEGQDIEWKWVKGHAGHALNERADALARQGVESVR